MSLHKNAPLFVQSRIDPWGISGVVSSRWRRHGGQAAPFAPRRPAPGLVSALAPQYESRAALPPCIVW
jgi:hypothetical protein